LKADTKVKRVFEVETITAPVQLACGCMNHFAVYEWIWIWSEKKL